MSKHKILFLVNHDVVIYNFRLELVEKLINNGFEVHISSPYGKKIKELEKIGCIFHEISIDRRGVSISKDFHHLIHYYKLFRKLQPNTVLTYTIKPNIYGGILCSVLNIPYIANITGLGSSINGSGKNIFKRLIKSLYSISLKNANQVFFQNKSNLDTFLNSNIPIKKYGLLPGSGVSLTNFKYLQYDEKKTIDIFYFGRLMKEKGTFELLEVAKQLKRKYSFLNFHLVGFSEDESLTEIVKDYEDKGFVKYHGYVEDTIPLIEQASAVIQPSHHEGMSNVLLEASASGRPILASNIPGCKEIIENERTGYLFNVNDKVSLNNCIEKFMTLSYEERREMGRKGRNKIEKEFSREIVIQRYLEELELIRIEEI